MDFMPFYNIKRGGKIRGETDFMKKGRKIMQCCFAVSILAIMVTLCILNISRFYDILMKNLSDMKQNTEAEYKERACGHFFRPLCLYSFYNLED